MSEDERGYWVAKAVSWSRRASRLAVAEHVDIREVEHPRNEESDARALEAAARRLVALLRTAPTPVRTIFGFC